MSASVSGEQLEMELLEAESKAERFRREADEWIEANAEAWSYITEQATRSASMGRTFGMKALCEHVRWHMEVNRASADFKINNNWTSAFTRRLVEEHPEVGPFVRTRHSVHD